MAEAAAADEEEEEEDDAAEEMVVEVVVETAADAATESGESKELDRPKGAATAVARFGTDATEAAVAVASNDGSNGADAGTGNGDVVMGMAGATAESLPFLQDKGELDTAKPLPKKTQGKS